MKERCIEIEQLDALLRLDAASPRRRHVEECPRCRALLAVYQEFLEDGWFQDSVPLDWHKSEEFSGLVRMYRDLIHLRLNRSGCTRGLSGSGLNTFHQNQADNVIAYHRWHQGGPGDDVVVVVNLSHLAHENYQLGFPSPGTWRLRLNSDWKGYSRAFGNQACSDVVDGT